MARAPSTDGVDVVVHDLGPDPAGAPAVLAHATGFHGLVWAPLARRLTGLHCWAPDLRGHGDSPAPTARDYAWDGFADDVLAVVDALGLAGPIGVGHSKGGAALLLAEARRPGTFSTLWVYEPVVFPPEGGPASNGPDEESPLVRGARQRRDRFDSFAAAEANFAGKPPMDAFDAQSRRIYVEHGFEDDAGGGVRLKCRPEDEARIYEMGRHHRAWDQLGSVTCPVSVVRGSVEGPGPAALAAAVADRLPQGRLEAHDELGHFGPLQDPAGLASSVLATIGRS